MRDQPYPSIALGAKFLSWQTAPMVDFENPTGV